MKSISLKWQVFILGAVGGTALLLIILNLAGVIN